MQPSLIPARILTTNERDPFSVASFDMEQKRLPKYSRSEASFDAVANRQITPRSLDIIEKLASYHWLSTSLLLALTKGNNVTNEHLKVLYHKKLINRFAFTTRLNPGEFIYYLDNKTALDLLVEERGRNPNQLDYDRVRYNREKNYHQILYDPDKPGSLLFLKHELMISRFHAMLELACKASNGEVKLASWAQGPKLWHSVHAPKASFNEQRDLWGEGPEQERLPHRPDAFFTLKTKAGNEQHFFYEADRKTTQERKRVVRKLRAHFQYIVKQKKHETEYGVKRIKAVLIETIDDEWAAHLCKTATHPIVCGSKPTSLFWFTTSRLFEHGLDMNEPERPKRDFFLSKPEVVFGGIWAKSAANSLCSLLDD
jgi:hypothetical protein